MGWKMKGVNEMSNGYTLKKSELPGKRMYTSAYSRAVNDFIATGDDCCEVSMPGVNAKRLYYGLYTVVKRRTVKCKVRCVIRGEKVYLCRTDCQTK